MRKTYKKRLIVVITSFLILLSAALIIYWKPIAIRYHNHRINTLLRRKPKLDPVSGLSFFGDDWNEAFEKHRDKLVELGYLKRKEYPLSYITVPSIESRRLWDELGETFPNNPYFSMQGYEPNTPDVVTVWSQADNLAEWERVITAHDAPPTNIVYVPQKDKFQNMSAFVGRWINEDGAVCYIITDDSEGNLRIESPQGDMWRTVFKNIRLEREKIVFDQFTYTDPNENFKTLIDKSGEHPFSGVRCETVLKVNPTDFNELLVSFLVLGKYDYTDPNTSILRRLK